MLQIADFFEATLKRNQYFLEGGLKSPECLDGRIIILARKLSLTEVYSTNFHWSGCLELEL